MLSVDFALGFKVSQQMHFETEDLLKTIQDGHSHLEKAIKND
jgi:hypothetical protein